ncbi:MAG: hypothetical protein AB7I33_04370 [Gemmatimonadales bacterium]
MHTTLRRTACLLLIVTSGCRDGFGGACDASIQPGIIVVIRDSATGTPLAAGASGYAIDGALNDPLHPYGFDGSEMVSRAGADERPGTYTVLVTHPGYSAWSRAGIRLTRGECHVNQVTLTADLVPAAP